MKKFFISFIACLMLTCCCAPSDYSGYDVKPSTSQPVQKQKPKYEYFDTVKNSAQFTIVKHRETGVMYMINYHGGITVIVNEDGTPYVQK